MNFLAIIVDCDANNWGKLIKTYCSNNQISAEKVFQSLVQSVSSFSNAHLSLNATNKVAIFGANMVLSNPLLYSSVNSSQLDATSVIEKSIRAALLKSADIAQVSQTNRLGKSIATAFCHINRFKKEYEDSSGHMLILNLGMRFDSEHSSLMNIFFSAHKQDIAIDIANLDETSTLLQQACDISAGVYLQVTNPTQLLQQLMILMLGDSSSRTMFARNSVSDIDYRANCHCHGTPVSIGWVCSVCLCVQCQFTPICLTCGTIFKIDGLARRLRKRKRLMSSDKSNSDAYKCIYEMNNRILFEALNSIDGPKSIVWDSLLMKKFDMVSTTDQLKEHKVAKMVHLERPLNVSFAENSNVIFIISTLLSSVNKLIAFLGYMRTKQNRCANHVFFVPEASFICRSRLEQQPDISFMLKSIISLPIRIFPLYKDFFTLFMDKMVPDLLISEDWKDLQKCASALHQLELANGNVPIIRCKGKWSAQILDILKKMRTQEKRNSSSDSKFTISDLVIIDRWADPLTLLLTQPTYGGLIDEILTLSPSGTIKTNLSTHNSPADPSNEVEVSLRDDMFSSLKDLHINNVGKCIRSVINELQEDRKTLKANPLGDSLAESKVIVRKLVDMQKTERSIDIHTTIAGHLMTFVRDDYRFSKFFRLENEILNGEHGDKVIPMIETLLIEAYEPKKILRLISIQSLVCCGLKSSTYSTYRRLFLQNYGIYKTSLWLKMELMGLITEKGSKIKKDYAQFDYANVRKNLAYSSSAQQSQNVYGEHVPFLIRYIETGLKNNWKDWTTIFSTIDSDTNANDSTFILLFVVGGITMAELSSLRNSDISRPLIVISTSLLNTNSLMQTIDSI